MKHKSHRIFTDEIKYNTRKSLLDQRKLRWHVTDAPKRTGHGVANPLQIIHALFLNLTTAKLPPAEKNSQSCNTFVIKVLNVQVAYSKLFIRSSVYYNLHEYQNRKLPPTWRNKTPFLSDFSHNGQRSKGVKSIIKKLQYYKVSDWSGP